MNSRYLSKYNRAVINMRRIAKTHGIYSRRFRYWNTIAGKYYNYAIATPNFMKKFD